MNQTAVLHKGLLLDCKVCNPPTETQEKRERRKRRGPVSLDMVIRRQVAFDLGEDEPQKDERFQLLQKYGVAAPRIDRMAIKPNWMGVAEWKRKQNEWYKATKGLVAPQQRRSFPSQQIRQGATPTPSQSHLKRKGPFPTNNPSRPWHPDHRRDTKAFRPNSGRTRMETRQS